MDEQIRGVLAEHARLARPVDGLDDGADLYAAGLTSHASVSVMLALEDTFDVEFPEELLKKSTFSSVATIRTAVSTLVATARA